MQPLPAAQNLQQKLLSTRYSVVDQIITLKSSLDQQKLKRRRSEEKLQEIKRKVLQLENQDRLEKYEAKKYQRKLMKMEDSQNVVAFMANIKGHNIRERQEDLLVKRSFCHQVKQQLRTQRDNSLHYHQTRKETRIQKLRQQNFNASLDRKRKSETELESRRKNKEKIRNQEAIAKERLKRYSEFRLAQAQINYRIKKEQEMLRQEALRRELSECKKEKEEEQSIFRKTQILDKQVKMVESLYLTSAD